MIRNFAVAVFVFASLPAFGQGWSERIRLENERRRNDQQYEIDRQRAENQRESDKDWARTNRQANRQVTYQQGIYTGGRLAETVIWQKEETKRRQIEAASERHRNETWANVEHHRIETHERVALGQIDHDSHAAELSAARDVYNEQIRSGNTPSAVTAGGTTITSQQPAVRVKGRFDVGTCGGSTIGCK